MPQRFAEQFCDPRRFFRVVSGAGEEATSSRVVVQFPGRPSQAPHRNTASVTTSLRDALAARSAAAAVRYAASSVRETTCAPRCRERSTSSAFRPPGADGDHDRVAAVVCRDRTRERSARGPSKATSVSAPIANRASVIPRTESVVRAHPPARLHGSQIAIVASGPSCSPPPPCARRARTIRDTQARRSSTTSPNFVPCERLQHDDRNGQFAALIRRPADDPRGHAVFPNSGELRIPCRSCGRERQRLTGFRA